MKYHIKTYGCQMNHSDSERIAGVLEMAGYEKTAEESEADLIVINMCSVRKSAVDRIAGNFKKYKKYKINNPNFKTVITGCVLKSDRKRFEKLFDLVLDIKEIESLPERIKKCHCEGVKTTEAIPKLQFNEPNNEIATLYTVVRNDNSNYFHIQPQHQSKITAYVPIMTGCNNFCSYCVVPYTRGREKSRAVDEILNEIRKLIKSGYKEIILLGQNVNSYKPDKNTDFPKLLRLINNIPGNFWIRFLTSHPKDVTKELIKTVAKCDKCTEYIHLALQSGDDDILQKMNRKYTTEHFLNIVKMIRRYIPNCAITTDIIVGFPTETEKQFQNTIELMKKVKFDMVYINKYSPRAGTESYKMKDDVSWTEKKKWEVIANKILRETALENNQKYIGETIKILVEKVDDKFIYGKTRSFKNVKLELEIKNQELIINNGKFVKIKITQTDAWGLEGKMIK
ncbi:MAG: tRNA (N6-isopentenyl adenosine(37)-C2)-methylthiotransferase MiaB [Patescibacteria group bacterium]|nr:tRNA (N6-isopentenyl adenosine(37)-C2)-methylthiotransferase MiaB [Patescibacteria group bacterium]